jgi:hypothetical protein
MTGWLGPMRDADAQRLVFDFHKGRGIQHRDLRARLDPRLRAAWGIAEAEPLDRVRAIVALRLKAVLDSIGEPELALIVWTAYNVGVTQPPPPLADRYRDLFRRYGRTFSQSTCQRRLDGFHEHLRAGLTRPQQALSEHELRQARYWLDRNVRPDAEEAPAAEAVDRVAELIRILPAPAEHVIQAFLESPGYAPASDDGSLLPTALDAWGSWLFVFTSPELFERYRAATRAKWRKVVRRTGREIVRYAHGCAEPTGVLVNASPRRGSGAKEALPLPPVTVARLAASR